MALLPTLLRVEIHPDKLVVWHRSVITECGIDREQLHAVSYGPTDKLPDDAMIRGAGRLLWPDPEADRRDARRRRKRAPVGENWKAPAEARPPGALLRGSHRGAEASTSPTPGEPVQPLPADTAYQLKHRGKDQGTRPAYHRAADAPVSVPDPRAGLIKHRGKDQR